MHNVHLYSTLYVLMDSCCPLLPLPPPLFPSPSPPNTHTHTHTHTLTNQIFRNLRGRRGYAECCNTQTLVRTHTVHVHNVYLECAMYTRLWLFVIQRIPVQLSPHSCLRAFLPLSLSPSSPPLPLSLSLTPSLPSSLPAVRLHHVFQENHVRYMIFDL